MGNSKKRHQITKSGRWLKNMWWRIIRTRWKQELRTNKEEAEFKHPYSINNQYDHCDYKHIGCNDNCYCVKTFGRKKCFDK